MTIKTHTLDCDPYNHYFNIDVESLYIEDRDLTMQEKFAMLKVYIEAFKKEESFTNIVKHLSSLKLAIQYDKHGKPLTINPFPLLNTTDKTINKYIKEVVNPLFLKYIDLSSPIWHRDNMWYKYNTSMTTTCIPYKHVITMQTLQDVAKNISENWDKNISEKEIDCILNNKELMHVFQKPNGTSLKHIVQMDERVRNENTFVSETFHTNNIPLPHTACFINFHYETKDIEHLINKYNSVSSLRFSVSPSQKKEVEQLDIYKKLKNKVQLYTENYNLYNSCTNYDLIKEKDIEVLMLHDPLLVKKEHSDSYKKAIKAYKKTLI